MSTATKQPTYSFKEAVERIGMCTELWELKMLTEVIISEKKRYSLYHLQLIQLAVQIMTPVVAR